MATKSDISINPRFWRIALIVLVILPLLPEIVTFLASLIAELHGCQAGDEKTCAIGDQSISGIIRFALKAGLRMGDSFSYGLAALWLAICFFAITLGWSGLFARLILSLSVSLIFAVVPYFGPILSIEHLINPNCQPNEAGVGPCVIFGERIGPVAHETVSMGWLFLIGAPIALGAFGVYALIILITHYFWGQRAPSIAL